MSGVTNVVSHVENGGWSDDGLVVAQVPLVDSSAYFSALFKAWQGTVDASDQVQTQRAQLEMTTRLLSDINVTMKAVGTTTWQADDGDASTDDGARAWNVTLGLLTAGVSPPAVSASWENLYDPGGLGEKHTYDSNGSENYFGHFYYKSGTDSSGKDIWLEANVKPEPSSGPYYDAVTASDGLQLNVTNVGWNYQGKDIRPFPPGTQATDYDGKTIPTTVMAGQLLHNTADGKYYMLTGANSLVQVPDPASSNFIPCFASADESTVQGWRDSLEGAQDSVARFSQKQLAFLQDLTGKLQSMLTLLTNSLERLERNMNSLIDRA